MNSNIEMKIDNKNPREVNIGWECEKCGAVTGSTKKPKICDMKKSGGCGRKRTKFKLIIVLQ